MRIGSSSTIASYQNKTNQIKKTQTAQKKTFKQLSTGKRVNTASDDAAALAISQKLIKQANSLNAGRSNIYSGIDLTNIADGAMSSISESLDDLYTNSIRAMNGTMSDSDRQILQQANEETIKTIDHITNTTNYNGKNLLDGSNKNISIYTGTSASNISGGDVTSKALGISNYNVTDANNIDLSSIDNALKSVSAQRSKMGAQANGLSAAARSNAITEENTIAADSRLTDTEMAKAASDNQKNKTLGAAQVLMMRNQMKQNSNILNIL